MKFSTLKSARRPAFDSVLGIPVIFDPFSPLHADSRGLWKWKRIAIGPAYFQLSDAQQIAVLFHEACHCLKFHLEKRILALPLLLFRPGFCFRLCQQQELEADTFAAEHGHGKALLSMLTQTDRESGPFYPRLEERIASLKEAIQ